MTEQQALTQEIVNVVKTLPVESLQEVAAFVKFVQYKQYKIQQLKPVVTPKPAPLEGLLEGYQFTEADIAQARQEMWGAFGERAL